MTIRAGGPAREDSQRMATRCSIRRAPDPLRSLALLGEPLSQILLPAEAPVPSIYSSATPNLISLRPAGTMPVPWCTTPIEAESSLGPDSHHPIISLSGIPSAVMVLRILHPILASTLCAANPLARIVESTIAL